MSKQIALLFSLSEHIALAYFDLIHSDIWGPALLSSLSGYYYDVNFIDDYLRYTWVYLMRAHSNILHIYTDITNMVYFQFNKHIKVFRSDGVHEHILHQCKLFSNPMVHSLSSPIHILTNKMVLLSASIVKFLTPLEHF